MTDKQLPKLLLVDDEASIIKALRRVLNPLEAEILSAESPAEALGLIREHRLALIVSDHRMPGMTGVELLAKSRELQPDAVRILLTGFADAKVTADAINSGAIKYFLNKPWDDEQLLSRVRESLGTHAALEENRHLQELTTRQNMELKVLNATLDRRVAEQTVKIMQQNEELRHSLMGTVKALSAMMDLRFSDVGVHSHRVAGLTRRLAEALEMGEKDRQDVFLAAFLHDIGKVSMSDRVVGRNPSQWTKEDTEIFRRHPILGQSCLASVDGFENVGLAIRGHHENWDGSGFPDGLQGSRIPIGARIVRVADSFDKQAFAKGYPDRKTLNTALAYLVQHSGTKFDPEATRYFISLDLSADFLFDSATETEHVEPQNLVEGMVVAEDVFTKNGMFLLPKGAKLSRGMIGRIRNVNAADPIAAGIQIFRNSISQKEAAHAQA